RRPPAARPPGPVIGRPSSLAPVTVTTSLAVLLPCSAPSESSVTRTQPALPGSFSTPSSTSKYSRSPGPSSASEKQVRTASDFGQQSPPTTPAPGGALTSTGRTLLANSSGYRRPAPWLAPPTAP